MLLDTDLLPRQQLPVALNQLDFADLALIEHEFQTFEH